MRLHRSVVDKLLLIYQNYGGQERDTKIRNMISNLDLTPYERQGSDQEVILVLTEDYVKALSGNGGR